MSVSGVGGKLPSNKVIAILAVVVLVSLVLALLTFVHTNRQASYDERYLIRAAETQVLAQRLGKIVQSAAKGELQSFKPLQSARDRYETIVWELKNGSRLKICRVLQRMSPNHYGIWRTPGWN